MRTWRIPVSWTMLALIDVEADTLAEAIEIARDDDGVIAIPDDGDYVLGTWQVDDESVEFIRDAYNDGEPDGKWSQLVKLTESGASKIAEFAEEHWKIFLVDTPDDATECILEYIYYSCKTGCNYFGHWRAFDTDEVVILELTYGEDFAIEKGGA